MTHGWTIADARSRMYQEEILYRADGEPSIDGWWSPLHLPREFSRLTLLVTDVRVQRLQAVNTDDCLAEGIPANDAGLVVVEGSAPMTAKAAYRALWDSLNAARGYGWATNPWVVAVSFTVHRGNIDQAPR